MPPQTGSENTSTSLVKSKASSDIPQRFTWEEIALSSARGNSKGARWLVINRKVYDITEFHWRHPAGTRIISLFSGQDATDAFKAFHKDEDLVKKYLTSLLIGELAPDQPSCEPYKNEKLANDFRELRSIVEQMGLLNPCYPFFMSLFLHAILLDISAWLVIWYFGKSWAPFLIAVALLTVGQTQYAYFQHDLGHVSAFQKPFWNRVFHIIVMGILKGIPPSHWNYMHNQHHAKPNCFLKDPDLNTHPILFSLGKKLSAELGKQKKKYMPYNYQHIYFILLAPLLFTIGVVVLTIRYTIMRKKWMELALIIIYDMRVCFMYVPLMGFQSFMAFYWLVRILESTWFIWISQMSHIPMDIDYDKNLDWVSSQLAATCNVDQSLFNDWFTGHLNFQIEHHLFPTMPRHNYWKVAPLVKSLCAKHGVEYHCKPLLTAFADILRTLKESGEFWQEAYLYG